MDALIQEIAKTFNIGNETVQNIINNYPQLRTQVAYYTVTTTIQSIMFVLGVIAFIAFLFSAGSAITNACEYAKSNYHREESGKRIVSLLTKVAIASFVVFVVCLIAFVVMTYLQAVNAPDVVFIQTLVSQMK